MNLNPLSIPKVSLKLILVMLLLMNVEVGLASTSQQEAEKKLAKVQSQIQKSQQSLEKQRGELGALEKQLRESEQLIGQLGRQISESKKVLNVSNQKIEQLNQQKEKLDKQLNKHQNLLYTQLRSEYLYGSQGKLKLLLNQEQPEKVGRNLTYYDYLHQARLQEMDQIKEILQKTVKIQSNIENEKNVAERITNKLVEERQAAEQAQQKRKQIVSSLNSSLSSEQKKLSSLEADEIELKKLLKELRETLANIAVIDEQHRFRKSKGKLFWPVVGKPKNKFGQKRNTARSNLNWQGVFIPSNEGNNVRSIFHGRVAFAEWMRGLGLLIIVDHGDGYMSLYGHNQSLFKQVGEWVEAGDKIATVGTSGGNTQAGLYFEIRKQGKAVNPAQWCSKPAAARTVTQNP